MSISTCVVRPPEQVYFLVGILCLLAGLVLSPASAFADGRIVKEDANADGKIDRIAHLDASENMVKLEIDCTEDGRMDTFQYYEKNVLIRIDKDVDGDGAIDVRDVLEKGKRTRHEKMNSRGQMVSVISFDHQERPLKWQRDTTGDGRMDTVSHYEEGKLTLITRDTSGDGYVNVWQTFENDKPREQKTDRDGDGRIEQIVYYDQKGLPLKSLHDSDGDGTMETSCFYRNGKLANQENDKDGNGRPERVVEYRDGQPTLERQDKNQDGAFDVLLRMDRGSPTLREEDTNHNGRMDRFTEFDASGRPLIMREMDPLSKKMRRVSRFKGGNLVSVEESREDRVVFTQFKNGKSAIQTIDENKDGRADQTITFDSQGIIARTISDTDHDGRIDTWQHYESGEMVRVEQDRNRDGNVDARLGYSAGKLVRVVLDRDGDGRFETTQRLDDSRWSMVTEIDQNDDRRSEERYCYKDDVLRMKEVFNARTGAPVLVEEYDEKGRIILSREAENGAGALNLIWRFDEDENAVLAEKDSDGDGRTDTWFHYKKGSIVRVDEDRNHDNKPDLWEVYDAAEVVVSRSEDLDFDGISDIEKKF